LVVDGHDSRLSAVFVDYVTNPLHEWKVNLGIPYATSYWQVGECSKQNGQFKCLLTVAKKEIVAFKLKHNLPINLTGEDIVPLVNYAWDTTFANVRTNKKAIAVRGWNPLNRNLLLDKEICTTTNNCEKIRNINNNNNNNDNTDTDDLTFSIASQVNTSTGFAGGTFGKLIQHVLRNGGQEKSKQQLTRGEDIENSIKKAKRMSSGVMIRHNIHNINNPIISTMIRNNRDNIIALEKKVNKKRRSEILSKITTINHLRLTKPSIDAWNSKDCKDFIQYKKQNGDPKLPVSLPLLRQRCIMVQGRMSPDCSVHASDNDDDVDNNNIVQQMDTEFENETVSIPQNIFIDMKTPV
jgi:hypothetical protein